MYQKNTPNKPIAKVINFYDIHIHDIFEEFFN